VPVLDKVLDKDKVIKVDVCTFKGRALLSVSKNYTFPQQIVKENSHFTPNDSVFIKGKNLPVFARNASVIIVAHTRAGDRFSFPGHIAVSTEAQLNITISQVEAELLPDRRRFYKVAMEIPCLLTSITRLENHVAVEPPIPGIILDINIGGIFLQNNRQVVLKQEDIVAVVLKDASGTSMELVSKVLRVKTTPEGEINGYGCCFLFLNSRQEEVVARFINQLQIEQRALERAETAH
jgi:c-di-GMP-binding flagellar brake protein YcgR